MTVLKEFGAAMTLLTVNAIFKLGVKFPQQAVLKCFVCKSCTGILPCVIVVVTDCAC